MPEATTVFLGGGTPSLLPAPSLRRILDAIPRRAGAEVTVECNPESVDPEKLAAYRAGGVTRLSVGVQSFRPAVLAALGRDLDPARALEAVTWARDAGFTEINLDLIYGTPGETIDDWRATLDATIALGPTHVSAYALTVEAGTPLAQRIAHGAPAPDDDDQAQKYELADDVLGAAGFEWYEISNWAWPGSECRHNLACWAQAPYVGIGCAAHGHHPPGRRWWNVRHPERYLERMSAGVSPEAGSEALDATTRAEEALALALRTRRGALIGPARQEMAAELAALGLLELVADRTVLTRRGRLLAGDVTARLLVAGAHPGPHADAVAAGTR